MEVDPGFIRGRNDGCGTYCEVIRIGGSGNAGCAENREIPLHGLSPRCPPLRILRVCIFFQRRRNTSPDSIRSSFASRDRPPGISHPLEMLPGAAGWKFKPENSEFRCIREDWRENHRCALWTNFPTPSTMFVTV